MPRLRLICATFLLAGCAGGSFPATVSLNTARPVEDVFTCAQAQIKALGFERSSIDVADRKLTAKRYDLAVRRADTNFRRAIDRLEIETFADASGGTTIKVIAHTFLEYTTQRGPTEEEVRASEGVKEAATQLTTKCNEAP